MPGSLVPYVLWDNDGVLVDTERLYYRATREVLLEIGIDLTEAEYRELFLRQSRGIWPRLEAEGRGPEELARLRAARDARYVELIGSEEIVIPGVGDLLGRLHGRVPMGVVTSARRRHFEAIHARTGFVRYFDFVVTADEVERTKPDPDLYLRALELTGRHPETCVAIEDSERGLAAAKAAGLRCWVIPSALSPGADYSAADRVLRSTAELLDLLGAAAPRPVAG